ncbi:MAG: hypothetical protein IPN16_13710 [Gemmatimonadetes bacterium]|nr:hypothetical protein [Gemmatimonadota bacterium]
MKQDPRRETPMPQLVERDSVANLLVTRIGEIHDAVLRVRDLKTQVQGFVTRTKEADSAKAIGAMGGTIVKKLETADPKLTTKAQNGQDIINYANGINGQYGFLLGQVEGNPVLTQGSKNGWPSWSGCGGRCGPRWRRSRTSTSRPSTSSCRPARSRGSSGRRNPGP